MEGTEDAQTQPISLGALPCHGWHDQLCWLWLQETANPDLAESGSKQGKMLYSIMVS